MTLAGPRGGVLVVSGAADARWAVAAVAGTEADEVPWR
jgi:hypothetical protein